MHPTEGEQMPSPARTRRPLLPRPNRSTGSGTDPDRTGQGRTDQGRPSRRGHVTSTAVFALGALLLAACGGLGLDDEVATEIDGDPFGDEAPTAEEPAEVAGEDEGEDEAADDSDAAAGELPDGITSFELETVGMVTWERHDDAFNYEIIVDGSVLRTAVGDTLLSPDLDATAADVRIVAYTFDGDELGEVEVLSLDTAERLVLRVDLDAFTEPFIGVAGSTETSSFSSSLGLTESPHVITTDPSELDIVLFGEAAERDEDVIVPTPWDIEDGEVVEEFGPFWELPLP